MPDIKKPDLTLAAQGDDFLLARIDADGNRSEIILSETDVIKLGRSAQQITQAILVRRSRPGAEAIALTPVVQIGLNVDHHKTEIQLLMIDPKGSRMGFSVPPGVVRLLLEYLPARLAEIDQAKPPPLQ